MDRRTYAADRQTVQIHNTFAYIDHLTAALQCWQNTKKVKVKASHTRYRALDLQLIPVYRQSARQVTISHPSCGRLPFFPSGLGLPSQLQSITTPWQIPSYTDWWQRYISVNNLPKVVTQLLPRVWFEPTTCWSQVQCCTHCITWYRTSY